VTIDEAAHIRLLNALMEAALDTKDLQSMVQILADRMADIIDADGCYLTFWNEERGITIPAAAYGPHRSSYNKYKTEPGERTFTASIAAAKHTLVVEDAYQTEYISPRIAARFPAKSVLGLPMISDGKMLGAIIISYDTPHRFTDTEIARSEHAARHVTFAVAKMLLLDDEKHRSEELKALNRIGIAINAYRDFDRVLVTISEQCKTIIDLDTFYLALYDAEKEELRFPLFIDGGEHKSIATRSIFVTPGMSGHIIRTRASLSIPDASIPEIQALFGTVRAGGIPSRAVIGVPLMYGDRVLGVMSVQSSQPNAYTAHQVQLMETIAAQSAIAIENARLNGELQLLSITDGLTGAFIFRHLMELGPLEFAKAIRHGRPLSLLFFDIDHFRDFNTNFGHATGNEVLRRVVDQASKCIREIDLFARYGGEEFVIVLPETPPEEALIVAERVRAAIESLRIHVQGRTESLGVTISIGVASTTPDSNGFQHLVDAANNAERKAKENGRNRVETAGQPAATP
jgi:diguanylate cyclase (GGDEF)-like protein